MARSTRDPRYSRPPQWDRLYATFFPDHTDGASRHVKVITEGLRQLRSPIRKLLEDAGYEPDHWAQSMEITVVALWRARAEIERLEREQEQKESA